MTRGSGAVTWWTSSSTCGSLSCSSRSSTWPTRASSRRPSCWRSSGLLDVPLTGRRPGPPRRSGRQRCLSAASCRCLTGWPVNGWTPDCHGSWGCRAPLWPTWRRTARVQLDGRVAGKSDRLGPGAWLEVELADPAAPPTVVAESVPGLVVVHDDDDVVVVDKPVGVAAHPSPGLAGPDRDRRPGRGRVPGGSTSGAAERQGIVHRLDVGTSGLMVVAKSENAYRLLKQAFHDRTVEKIYHAVVQGHPGPVGRHHRRPDRAPPEPRVPVRRGRRRQAQHHPLRGHRGVPGRQPGRGAPRDRAHPPDPGALRRRCATRAWATSPTVPTRRWPPGWGCSGSGCTPSSWGSTTRRPASWLALRSDYPADLRAALDVPVRQLSSPPGCGQERPPNEPVYELPGPRAR